MASSQHSTLTNTETSEKMSETSIVNDKQSRIGNDITILEENAIYIPDRYYLQMFHTGLLHQLVELVKNVNEEEKLLDFIQFKRRNVFENSSSDEHKRKKSHQNKLSTQEEHYVEPPFFDSNENGDTSPDVTYSTESRHKKD